MFCYRDSRALDINKSKSDPRHFSKSRNFTAETAMRLSANITSPQGFRETGELIGLCNEYHCDYPRLLCYSTKHLTG